jgi:riboflavin synthase
MFTGLIESLGTVVSFTRSSAAAILSVSTTLPAEEFRVGDSVAVNGICLTVTGTASGVLSFDVSPETIARSSFESLRAGDRVNLERALRAGDRLGGHIVTGHIDCCGRLSKIEHTSGCYVLTFTLPGNHARYLVEKGSVAIDGISLTVNDVSSEGFTVTIIPHSFANTTLSGIRPGNRVNIETDILGKYVEKLAQPYKAGSGLSMKTLAENGFL